MLGYKLAWMVLVGGLVLAACGGNEGERCSGASDCSGDTFCCTSGRCDDGICTYACRGDRDCPSDMVCRDDVCLFSCATSVDCEVGFECREHDGRLMCTGN